MRTADVTGSDQLMTSSVLHVRCGTEVRQCAIHVTRQGHWRLADADVSFPTLVDLIAYYCEPSRCALRHWSSSSSYVGLIHMLRWRNGCIFGQLFCGHPAMTVAPRIYNEYQEKDAALLIPTKVKSNHWTFPHQKIL